MPIADFLAPEAVWVGMRPAGKKSLLLEMAERGGAHTGRDPRLVYEALLQRERLGSTGVGSGVAIPHGKFEGIDRLTGLFFRLDRAVDFEALDGQPVDLVFTLLAPEHAGADHLKALAAVARTLRPAPMLAKLRAARDPLAIHMLLTGSEIHRAA